MSRAVSTVAALIDGSNHGTRPGSRRPKTASKFPREAASGVPFRLGLQACYGLPRS